MEVKVKIKRNYDPKSTLAVLINYKRAAEIGKIHIPG